MKDAFGNDIQDLPDFPGLVTVIQGGAQGSGLHGSEEIRNLISGLEGKGGHIYLNKAGAGRGTYNDGTNVYLDPNELPANATNAQLAAAAVAIAHEIGHIVDGATHYQQAANPDEAAQRGLNSEGFADRDEYIAAKELGVSMADPQLQQIIAGIDAADGGTSTDPNSRFSKDVVAAGANYASTDHPSSAPNLTYQEYYKDRWAIAHCAGAPEGFNFQNVQPGDVQITTNPDGSCTVTVPKISLQDGTTDTQTSTGTISSTGQVITGETDRYSGSTLIGKATEALQSNGQSLITITGQLNAGGDNATVALNSRPSPASPLVQFTGDGN